jgi:hypothetical protein
MHRLLVLISTAVTATALVAGARSAGTDAYASANARLARATPRYLNARLLVEEPVHGGVGSTPFKAIQRIYALDRPDTQGQAMRFFARRLGGRWRRRGSGCLVSASKLLVAVVVPERQRLGVMLDSRGATRCIALEGQIGDLVAVGYPDP